MRSIVVSYLCLILFGLPSASAEQAGVNIGSFRVVNINPESVDIELVVSNDGSNGSLCLRGLVKSRDGLVRTEAALSSDMPVGQNLRLPVHVLRPYGFIRQQTDYLVINIYSCGKNALLTRKFDWPHNWPEVSPTNPAVDSMDMSVQGPWILFLQNFEEEDFSAQDALLEKLNTANLRDKDGRWRLEGFSGAVNSLTQPDKLKDCILLIQKWRKLKPSSPGAAIAEAKYWAAYAWHIRGCIFCNNVDPVALRVFGERMKRAEQVLKDSKAYASNNPLWYETYLDISIDTKRDDKFIQKLFEEGIHKYPYFQPLYVLMAERWAPNSGEMADWKKVDELANQAADVTSDMDGADNYAWVYIEVGKLQKFEFNLFQDSHVSWLKMKDSLEELVKRYPSEDNLNLFGAFACRAGDKEAYLEVRPKIQGHIVPEKWPGNYSIDLCDHRFMQYS